MLNEIWRKHHPINITGPFSCPHLKEKLLTEALLQIAVFPSGWTMEDSGNDFLTMKSSWAEHKDNATLSLFLQFV